MLKKTGILVATILAATAATAPLAFADNVDYRYSADNGVERNQSNRCIFVQNSDGASDPLLGVVPLAAQQLQTLNCTNVGDTTVLDLDGDQNDVVLSGTGGGTTTPAATGGGTATPTT